MKLKRNWWKWVNWRIFLRPLKLWESAASCISFHRKHQWNVQCNYFSHKMCLNYLKLVNLLGKRHSVSEQLFKWQPKSPFSLATPQLHEDLDQTGNHIQTIPRNPPFRQGVICHIWPSQFGVHREQTQGVKIGISKIANYNSTRGHGKLRLSW